MTTKSHLRWRISAEQRLLFEDFDDGIVMFDVLFGATHLLNASAAETLAIVAEAPGLAAADIHLRLLERLNIADEALPLSALEDLVLRLEDLRLICPCKQ